MDGKLKQRLVGAIVLIALAVIFLPLLLDGNEQERRRIVQQVPEAPTFEIVEVEPQEIIEAMAQLESESEANLPREVPVETVAETDPSAIAKPSPALDASGLPEGWSLQVGSFEDQQRAVQLRAELRARGYRSYILKVPLESGDHYRVLVGPLLDRNRLQQFKVEIDRDYHVEGRILRYDIAEDVNLLGG